MLVLSRKAGESLVIGGEIVVTVVRIQGNIVKLGIEAPPGVAIARSELLQAAPPASADSAPATAKEPAAQAPAAQGPPKQRQGRATDSGPAPARRNVDPRPTGNPASRIARAR